MSGGAAPAVVLQHVSKSFGDKADSSRRIVSGCALGKHSAFWAAVAPARA